MALPNPLGTTPVGLGDMLQAQTADETDEERRKRLLQMQQQRGGAQPLSQMMGMTRATALSSVYGGGY